MELAFQKGAVDLIVGDDAPPSSAINQYGRNSDFSSYFLPMLTGTFVIDNQNMPFFSTQKARVAFLSDIDSAQIVSQVLNSKLASPATTMYGAGEIPGGADKQLITYNPSLMAAYAKTLKPGTPMTIAYPVERAQRRLDGEHHRREDAGARDTRDGGGRHNAQLFTCPGAPETAPDVFIDAADGPDGGSTLTRGATCSGTRAAASTSSECNVPEVDDRPQQGVETDSNALYVQGGPAVQPAIR